MHLKVQDDHKHEILLYILLYCVSVVVHSTV